MKKHFLLIVLMIVGMVINANAQSISQDEAKANAIRFLTTAPMNGGARKVLKSQPKLSATNMELKDVYAFNVEGGGYVIASGDERAVPVLGYSNNGFFDWDKIPANMRAWLEHYSKEIAALDKMHLPKYANESGNQHLDISPIITTQWGQSPVYNNLCPQYNGDSEKYKGQLCLTGCVATSLAQVMNYYKWPKAATTEIPAYNFTIDNVGLKNEESFSVEALQATTFDWDNMIPKYVEVDEIFETENIVESTEAQKNAVATLMRYCGQALNMAYSPVISLTFNNLIPYALRNYFGYDSGVKYVSASEYSIDEWDNLIYGELAVGRPVIISGSGPAGGHSFVCDGYCDGLYHINWGWNGAQDDYFALSVLNSSQGFDESFASGNNSFNIGVDAVIGIKPSTEQTEPIKELPELFIFGGIMYERQQFKMTFFYSSQLYKEAKFELGFFSKSEDGSLKPIYIKPSTIDIKNQTSIDDLVPYYVFNGLADGKYSLIPMYRCTSEANCNWKTFRNRSLALNLQVKNGEVVPDKSAWPMLEIQSSSFIGKLAPTEDNEIRLKIHNSGDEFVGSLTVLPVYIQDKDPQMAIEIIKNSTSNDEPPAYMKKGQPLTNGASIKAGATEIVNFAFKPEYEGNVVLVLMSPVCQEEDLSYGFINLPSFVYPDLVVPKYTMSYKEQKSPSDSWLDVNADITNNSDINLETDTESGTNYLEVRVLNGVFENICEPCQFIIRVPEGETINIANSFKDCYLNELPSFVFVYIDYIYHGNIRKTISSSIISLGTTISDGPIGEDAGIPDGIKSVVNGENTNIYYDLNGRSLNGKPTTSGVYLYKDSNSKVKKVYIK